MHEPHRRASYIFQTRQESEPPQRSQQLLHRCLTWNAGLEPREKGEWRTLWLIIVVDTAISTVTSPVEAHNLRVVRLSPVQRAAKRHTARRGLLGATGTVGAANP